MKRLIVIASAALLAACASSSPDMIQRSEAQRLAQVQDATVLNVRPVTVDGSQSGVGGSAGAAVGALAGSARSSGRESVAIGIIGAVVGGVLGNTVERATTRESAVEILVQLRNGERRAIVQAVGNEELVAGDAVILVTTGGKTRVTRAPASAVPTATPRS